MDYYQHFGLNKPPFEILAQPTSVYMSEAHREGLALLEWGLLHEPGCFTLLVGGVGTGKTTLINVIVNRHYDHARIAYVMNPKLSFEELLRDILEQLGYLSVATTKLDLLKKFEKLFDQLRPNERIAIIIDDAQALSDDILEELRLFSNYAHRGVNLKILLVGQPELLERLMSPSLRQFHQRIGARAVLNPLRPDEAYAYVDLKLQDSGGSIGRIFEQRALTELIAHSGGIPRQLNLLCNNALIGAYAAKLRLVTLAFARAAIAEYENLPVLSFERREPWGRQALRPLTAYPAASLSALGFIVLGGFYAFGVAPGSLQLVRGDRGKPVAAANFTQRRGLRESDMGRTAALEGSESRTLWHSASAGPVASLGTPPRADGDAKNSSAVSMPARRLQSTKAGRDARSTTANVLAFSVRSGDTIEGLARQHLGSEVDVKSVMKANPQLRDVNRIYPGETIFLPGNTTVHSH